MTDTTPGSAIDGGPGPAGLTDAEKLAALETYMKTLKVMSDELRAKVTADMQGRRVERVGAYLGSLKLAAVSFVKGRKTATVTDPAAALRWCLNAHPEEVVSAVNPAYLKALTDYAASTGEVGEMGVDPRTGETLPFIEVRQGNPYVSVKTTPEGVARMDALAHGFAGMLEGSKSYDPDFADRLENGVPVTIKAHGA